MLTLWSCLIKLPDKFCHHCARECSKLQYSHGLHSKFHRILTNKRHLVSRHIEQAVCLNVGDAQSEKLSWGHSQSEKNVESLNHSQSNKPVIQLSLDHSKSEKTIKEHSLDNSRPEKTVKEPSLDDTTSTKQSAELSLGYSKTKQLAEELSLDSSLIGVILGVWGSTCRSIEKATGAKIHQGKKKLYVTGTASQIASVNVEVARRIREHKMMNIELNDEWEAVPFITDKYIRFVIGKEGKTLHILREQSQAHIAIYHDAAHDSKVFIKGSDGQKEKALKLLQELVQQVDEGAVVTSGSHKKGIEQIRQIFMIGVKSDAMVNVQPISRETKMHQPRAKPIEPGVPLVMDNVPHLVDSMREALLKIKEEMCLDGDLRLDMEVHTGQLFFSRYTPVSSVDNLRSLNHAPFRHLARSSLSLQKMALISEFLKPSREYLKFELQVTRSGEYVSRALRNKIFLTVDNATGDVQLMSKPPDGEGHSGGYQASTGVGHMFSRFQRYAVNDILLPNSNAMTRFNFKLVHLRHPCVLQPLLTGFFEGIHVTGSTKDDCDLVLPPLPSDFSIKFFRTSYIREYSFSGGFLMRAGYQHIRYEDFQPVDKVTEDLYFVDSVLVKEFLGTGWEVSMVMERLQKMFKFSSFMNKHLVRCVSPPME